MVLRVKVGYRTLKTAIGTGCSIWVAELLQLKFFVAAGIITILCIKPTKKQSLKTAGERFLACIIGLVCAGLLFEIFGYAPWILSIVLLMIIPICVRLKMTDGIVSSFVIVLHLYVLKTISMEIVLNELALIAIGVGFALILNLYMPSLDEELKRVQKQLEEHFKKIFSEFAVYLRNGHSEWDGKEITETTKLLQQAKRLALKDIENQFKKDTNSFYVYFEMREKQFDIIVRMLPIISSLHQTHWQGKVIADFLEDLKEGIHPKNTSHLYLEKLEQIREEIRKTPLPKNNREFEIRASFFHLLNEMERYLLIKKRFNIHPID